MRDLEHAKGRHEPPRAYSMSSAPHERHVAITIKAELYTPGAMDYPPLLSWFLVRRLSPGDRLIVAGFLGGYTLSDDVETTCDHLLHLCAGSGSVPNVSILKDSLKRHRLRHTFVYANRTWRDVIFRDALTALGQQHESRLRVIHCLTREAGQVPTGVHARRGRVGIDLVEAILQDEPRSMVCLCGPALTAWEQRACHVAGIRPAPRFVETMAAHLRSLGVARELIRVETFG